MNASRYPENSIFKRFRVEAEVSVSKKKKKKKRKKRKKKCILLLIDHCYHAIFFISILLSTIGSTGRDFPVTIILSILI